MKIKETIYYLNNNEDYILKVDKYTKEVVSYVHSLTTVQRGRILERGFKLIEGEHYLICENGIKKYCYIKNQNLLSF